MTRRGRYERWTVDAPAVTFTRPTYLTDTACGFCVGHMARIQRAFPGTFDAVDFRTAPLADLGLTLREADAAGHMVTPLGDGRFRVAAGHLSWADVLEVQRPAWARAAGRVLGWAPLGPLAAGVYRWVASNRQRLGGSTACALPTGGAQ